jgi:hypothetical protein
VCVVQEITSEDKVRLLMIYAATHPEKLDATKRMQWMKVRTVVVWNRVPVALAITQVMNIRLPSSCSLS